MLSHPILYSGTNSNDRSLRVIPPRHGCQITSLSRHFTTHAGEAMTYAFLTAKRWHGEMAIIVLPEWTDGCFMENGLGHALNRHGEDADYYELSHLYRGSHRVKDPDSIEQRTLQLYDEADMARFIDEHCTRKEEEKQNLDIYLERLREERAKRP